MGNIFWVCLGARWSRHVAGAQLTARGARSMQNVQCMSADHKFRVAEGGCLPRAHPACYLCTPPPHVHPSHRDDGSTPPQGGLSPNDGSPNPQGGQTSHNNKLNSSIPN